jgi:hypothetical protein
MRTVHRTRIVGLLGYLVAQASALSRTETNVRVPATRAPQRLTNTRIWLIWL